MNGRSPGSAVVIGAGAAGLFSARVLSDFFDRVVICESDALPGDPVPRRGIPQDRHVHLLLTRGIQILEKLFPGILTELENHGARLIDTGDELMVLGYYGWNARYPAGLRMLTCSRPLLDWCIRQRIAENPRTRILQGCRVVGLVDDSKAGRITGVRYESRISGMGRHEVHADLVVDASGRFSQAPQWLAELGYDTADETIVDPYLGYATRLYDGIDADRHLEGRKAVLVLGLPPNLTRAGVLIPIENQRWIVTLVGIARDYPPTDDAGFHSFARTLRSETVYEAISDARPASPIFGYRSTRNRFRHYESTDHWPDGFVAVGDSVCALNPIYAQGISLAACGVVTLRRCLVDAGGNRGLPAEAAGRFQRKLARVNRSAWLMATCEDYRWPRTEGDARGTPMRLIHRYLDAVLAIGAENPAIDRRFAEVAHMLKSPRALLHPTVSMRALSRMI